MNDKDIEVVKGQLHALAHVISGLIVTHPNPKFFYKAIKAAAADREQAKAISILSPKALQASDDFVDHFLGIAASASGEGHDEPH
jgi:hypothetical protein